jgi:prepilin-type processing-associated H-X9-DG protein
LSSYDHFGTSYAANVFWTGVVAAGCVMKSNSPYIRPLSRVPNPANTLLYIENVGRYSWQYDDPCQDVFPDILPTPTYPEGRGGPKWHQVGWIFNMAFTDGHASATKMKSYDRVDPYPTNLTGDCAPTGQCRCIIVRGNGWQLDTLPAATVASVHSCPSAGRPSQDGVGICGWPTGASCP